jgi:predicted peroxiredoxin
MKNQKAKIKDLKEKIHDLKEYINSSGCKFCLDMINMLKAYEDEVQSLEEISGQETA